MLTKKEVINKALEIGFADVGFTNAEPFNAQKDFLLSRQEEYGWAPKVGIDLVKGVNPKDVYPNAKSMIVVLATYFDESFPKSIEGYFGRCYLDDDRMTKNGLTRKIKALRIFLRDNGIDSKVPGNIPQRVAAARAGIGTYGKNCLLYSNKVARQSSWVLPVPILVDHEFAPDEPTMEVGCPDWCRNACIVACPTGALKGPRKIDPRKCISYLTYFGEGITPKELREPMGMWVYGCDRCQNICPRNRPWLAKELPINENVKIRAKNFELTKLLHMDKKYFRTKIWPHMFYMSFRDMWRWKMNVARVMGNSLDPKYIPDLIRAFEENKDERVKSMTAWALGRIGGLEAKNSLKNFLNQCEGLVKEEILAAIESC